VTNPKDRNMNSAPLFEAFHSKNLDLRNRVVMAPMTRRFSPGGVPSAEVAAYYRRRAEGGVGLVITEGTTVSRHAASNDAAIPNFHEAASLEGWAQVVAQVHAAGAKIAPQLWHQGIARAAGTGPYPEAASEGPVVAAGRAKAMDDTDIADTIAAFAASAGAAKRIGFDAVELHGAHGYLIDQFLWAATNRRTDSYGREPAGRLRFALEVVRAVRTAVGPGFPVIFRYSQWKVQDYGARLAQTPSELEALLGPLADAGVDIFHASTRRFWQPEFAGSDLNLAGWTQKLSGRPAISVGSVGLADDDFVEQLLGKSKGASVGTLDELVRRMNDGEFDLVAVGRALLTDPQWPIKVREGRLNELKPFEKSHLASLV
jgi:2,4-dienoyl-CoA reductase-like NADH-dependent reductase (Old Yellow Enzyme family)